MYVFMGVARWKDVMKGRFDPCYILGKSKKTDNFVMREVRVTNLRDSPPIIVNSMTDQVAQDMVAYACGVTRVVKDRRGEMTTLRLRGLLMWYECDAYARPNGRVLMICSLPNYKYLSDLGPVDRPLSWRMADVPSSEALKTVIKPVLAQVTRKTEKEKEKEEHEKLVCGTECG